MEIYGTLVIHGIIGSCKTYGNMEIGKCAKKHIFKFEQCDFTIYVFLSNIYATSSKWEDPT